MQLREDSDKKRTLLAMLRGRGKRLQGKLDSKRRALGAKPES